METVYRDYSKRGVRFFYLYKALAHPEFNGYVTPYTKQERLQHVAEAKRTLGSEITWLCDTMDNVAKHALGNRPNSEFLIAPDGKVLVKRLWSNPSQLRADLERWVGPVEPVTSLADLEMKIPPPPKRPARDVVARSRLPNAQPLHVKPMRGLKSDTPFYVKLRAEADRDLIQQGHGKLYLGFFLDPLYKVHWNNQAQPPRWTVEVAGETTVVPQSGEGPQVAVAADIDPREFLVDVEKIRPGQALHVQLSYIACDDAETFCNPVTQTFEVVLEIDADGGRRFESSSGPNRLPNRGQPAIGLYRPAIARRLLIELDRDRDGTLSEQELAQADQSLQRLDRNQDGKLTAEDFRLRDR